MKFCTFFLLLSLQNNALGTSRNTGGKRAKTACTCNKKLPLFFASSGLIRHVVHGGRSKTGKFHNAFIFTIFYDIIATYASAQCIITWRDYKAKVHDALPSFAVSHRHECRRESENKVTVSFAT